MKKTFLLLTASALTLTACKKNSYPEVEPDKEIYELPYNKEGIAANKAQIEAEGRDLVKKIDDLNTDPAIKALESLSELDAPELSFAVSAVVKMGASGQKVAAISTTLSQMAAVATQKESYKFSNAFGIYKYNATTGNWDKTAADNKIELHFPAIKGGKSNNAIFTMTYKSSGQSFEYTDTDYNYVYDPSTGNGQYEEKEVEETYELPAEIKGTLTIGGNAALTLNSTFTYHSDNLPKSALVKLAFGSYTAQTEVNNDNKTANAKFEFAKQISGTWENLISMSGNSNFNNISFDKITDEDADLANQLQTANSMIKVGGIALAGQIDFKTVYNEVKSYDDKAPVYPQWDSFFGGITPPNWSDFNGDYTAYDKAVQEYQKKYDAAVSAYNKAYDEYSKAYEKHDKEYYTALAASLNKNSAVVIANTKTNLKIASIIYQLDEDKDEYHNGNTLVTNYYYNVEPLLVFGDGSKVSFETFGETGFQNLIDDIEKLLNKFGS